MKPLMAMGDHQTCKERSQKPQKHPFLLARITMLKTSDIKKETFGAKERW
jgi:hypothetical protein